MRNMRNNTIVLLASWVVWCAIALVMAMPAGAQERETVRDRDDKLKGTVSESQLDAALQRGLPGRVMTPMPANAKATVEKSGGLRGAPARSVEMADIPQKTTTSSIPGLADGGRPLSGLTEDEYQALKRLVAMRAARGEVGTKPSTLALRGGVKAIVRPVQMTQITPNAATAHASFFYGQKENGLDPPDMGLATSENFVVQVVNASIAVYAKNGVLQAGFPKDADTFFGVAAGTFIFDPRAFYDWANHRFFVLMDTFTSGTAGGSLYFAISKTQDPRGGWWIYHFTPAGLGAGICGDFPTLGHDTTNWGTYATKGGIYIGVNLWTTSSDCGGASFSNNAVYLLPKDALYDGGGYGYWYFTGFNLGGVNMDTLQPVNVTDRADKPSTIFLMNTQNYNFGGGHCSSACNEMVLWGISGPTAGTVPDPHNPFAFLQGGNGPIVTSKVLTTLQNFTFPVNAAEPGCTTSGSPCVDTDYVFISGAVKYHAGEIFGSFNTAVASSPATTGPIWFDVHPSTDNNGQVTNAVIRQEDCFLCGGWANSGSAYYANLQPDQENNVVMIYNYSDNLTYPRSQLTSRRVTYGDSLMDGAGSYFNTGGTGFMSGRWGDYTATAPDFTIANRGLIWMSGEYATPSGWATIIGWTQYLNSDDQ
ncbi:hypothetical protein Acid345_1910 [Candidatus Koribacter versatilis Ellin345]|uniref:Uncharacterized protein n=1 Tax=Koribacter versatilis (strain Ellin345) TaxID=204669 RepID=Q1IQD9_KORVE|nr:hypothetical protein [Candidatus Koribacter versatilis]ABF40911.1 hypothetical protein Acid345_1910 [Candidatus Koribacter versatilis Ellin345]